MYLILFTDYMEIPSYRCNVIYLINIIAGSICFCPFMITNNASVSLHDKHPHKGVQAHLQDEVLKWKCRGRTYMFVMQVDMPNDPCSLILSPQLTHSVAITITKYLRLSA